MLQPIKVDSKRSSQSKEPHYPKSNFANMYPIIPDGEATVSHTTLGKDKINPEKIYNQLISIIS